MPDLLFHKDTAHDIQSPLQGASRFFQKPLVEGFECHELCLYGIALCFKYTYNVLITTLSIYSCVTKLQSLYNSIL